MGWCGMAHLFVALLRYATVSLVPGAKLHDLVGGEIEFRSSDDPVLLRLEEHEHELAEIIDRWGPPTRFAGSQSDALGGPSGLMLTVLFLDHWVFSSSIGL